MLKILGRTPIMHMQYRQGDSTMLLYQTLDGWFELNENVLTSERRHRAIEQVRRRLADKDPELLKFLQLDEPAAAETETSSDRAQTR